MMPLTVIREAAGCYLVFTLAATGIAKLHSSRTAATGVRLENVVPRHLALPVVVAVATAELALATLVAADSAPMVVGVATAGLLLCFGGYKLAVAAKTGNLACSCTGAGIAYKATRPGVLAAVAAATVQAALAVSWAVIPPHPEGIFGLLRLLALATPVVALLAGSRRRRPGDPLSSVHALSSVHVGAGAQAGQGRARGEVGDHEVSDHAAQVVAALGVQQVSVEDGLEGVAVGAAEDAEAADDHMDVEGVQVVAEQARGAAALHDAAEHVQRGGSQDLAGFRAPQMPGVRAVSAIPLTPPRAFHSLTAPCGARKVGSATLPGSIR